MGSGRSNEPAGAGASDKRAQPRRRRLQGGRIGADDGGFSLACTIVDMSEAGARVRIGRSLHLPAQFFLIDTAERVAFKARLVWACEPEYGLRLLKRYRLGKPVEAAHG